MRKKLVLITGIKGFLGMHLKEYLIKEYEIYGLGRTNEVNNGIRIFSSKNLEKIDLNPDYIVMCHASIASGTHSPSMSELQYVNRDLTKEILINFPKSKYVYASSVSVYDDNEFVIDEDSKTNPKSNYAKSKKDAEDIVIQYNGVIVRISSMFGEKMKENTIIPRYVNQALKFGKITVWGNGERKQNYIYVKSVCHYIYLIIKNFRYIAENQKIILAVSSKEYSNTELAEIILQETDSSIEYINEDHSPSYRYSNIKSNEILNLTPNNQFEVHLKKYIQWKKRQF